jgi:crotonobetainyl-CoA:carnitine CoA-transferase CaiB-like acyl-CoA transferase
VIELARVLAGPWAGQILADLGADVIKVERPGTGDETRAWGPPFVETVHGAQSESAYFHCCNRGKRSIAVDLTTAEGQEIVRRLAATADVLIENYKVGALVKYGLDYACLSALNPRLVYCSITGFGQNGPYASRAGYDFMIQGLGGIMDLTGSPHGEPHKIGVAFADIFTGVYAVIGIQAALAARGRSGEGQHVDMSLLDTQVGVLANQAMNYLISGHSPRRLGNAHPNIVPYQTFAVADGHIILAVGNDAQFQRCCEVLGTPELARDQRFQTNRDRVAHREELTRLLAVRFSSLTREQVLQHMEAAGVPAGPINSVADVFNDAQVEHRGMRLDLPCDRAAGGSIPGVRSPVRLSATPLVYDRASPALGEHTQEILSELGLAPEQLPR